jgi:xanthine dehydrogenase YagR molybdenum-binding subunit
VSIVADWVRTGSVSALRRVDGPEKVTGRARYVFEHVPGNVVYGALATSTIAKGRVASIDRSDVLERPDTVAVITAANAPELPGREDRDLAVLQSSDVAYYGQIVAIVVATTLEAATAGAEDLVIRYDVADHDVELHTDHPRLYAPDHVNPSFPTDSVVGDVDAALAAAPVSIDATYTTPQEHNNPMEPHATVAWWDGPVLTMYDSVQGTLRARAAIAAVFGIAPADVHLMYPYVGGGFGAKGLTRPPSIATALAARVVGRR